MPAIVFLFAGMARSFNFCGFFAGMARSYTATTIMAHCSA
jgi:hypothetical protein